MRNEFTYNLFFKKGGEKFEEIMEEILLNYVKEYIHRQNCPLNDFNL